MNRGLKGLFAHNELPECKLNSHKNSSIHGPFTLIFFSFVRLLKIKGYNSISFLEMQLVNKTKKASKMCILNPILFSCTMTTNLLNWCNLVSISKNVVFLRLFGGKNLLTFS